MPKIRKISLLVLLFVILILSLEYLALSNSKLTPNLIPQIQNLTTRYSQPTTDNTVSIILTGDIMLGRTVMTTSLDAGDPAYPFREVAPVLRTADIVFANLENPIITNCPRSNDGLKFCADPQMLLGLKFAGIGVVNLANNHTRNYGANGLSQTKNFLEKSGILYTDDGGLLVGEYKSTKFGFLGFELVDTDPTDSDLELIKTSDRVVDVLIVAVHWGQEYQNEANIFQKEWAKKFVEAGADVIAGSHPHWVQNIDHINQKPVYYSLGNFVFDQMWSRETRSGLAVRLTFKGGQLIKEEKLPIFIQNWSQPKWTN